MKKLGGQVSFFSEKGGRPYQEDQLVAVKKEISDQESGWLLAVMDGHRGSEVSGFCVKNLESLFIQSLAEKKKVDQDVLKETLELLNEGTRSMAAGSTISLVFISEATSAVFVAVLGDSPVIILDKNGALNISPDHNARSNPKEKDAAKRRGAYYTGGYIWAGEYGLQMARSLGDCDMDKVLSRKPEIYKVNLGPGSLVLVASDGVFDPGHLKTANQIKRLVAKIKKNPTFDAKDLVNDAISRRTGDNATAILWKASKTKKKVKNKGR